MGFLFIIKRIGFFILDNWKIVLAVLAVLTITIVVYRACRPGPPKLDERAIQKAQQAIAENDRKAMTEVLVESEVAEKAIDQNLANAENEKLKALAEARQKAAGMTNEELAAELERRAKEQ